MYACAGDENEEVSLIQIGDGGYLDNSGIQAALQSWDVLETEVAKHNESHADAPIAPILVVIGNGYRSEAQPPTPGRQRELVAPLAGLGIPKAYLSGARLEAEALTEFPSNPQRPGILGAKWLRQIFSTAGLPSQSESSHAPPLHATLTPATHSETQTFHVSKRHR